MLLNWRRLLRVPRTAGRSNQSIVKEISPEYSLEGLMLKLKPQYFGHLMQRANSLEKTLMLGKIEGRRRRGDRGWDGWMASLTQWTWVWASSKRWWRTMKPGMLQSTVVAKSWTQLSHWTTTTRTRHSPAILPTSPVTSWSLRFVPSHFPDFFMFEYSWSQSLVLFSSLSTLAPLLTSVSLMASKGTRWWLPNLYCKLPPLSVTPDSYLTRYSTSAVGCVLDISNTGCP